MNGTCTLLFIIKVIKKIILTFTVQKVSTGNPPSEIKEHDFYTLYIYTLYSVPISVRRIQTIQNSSNVSSKILILRRYHVLNIGS